jgi:uncharacterized protein YcfJ
LGGALSSYDTLGGTYPGADALVMELTSERRKPMRSSLKILVLAAGVTVLPLAAQSGTLEGAAIGAGAGAVVAGPPGAVVGGAIGAVTGGPNIVTRSRVRHVRHVRHCWLNRAGRRVCG